MKTSTANTANAGTTIIVLHSSCSSPPTRTIVTQIKRHKEDFTTDKQSRGKYNQVYPNLGTFQAHGDILSTSNDIPAIPFTKVHHANECREKETLQVGCKNRNGFKYSNTSNISSGSSSDSENSKRYHCIYNRNENKKTNEQDADNMVKHIKHQEQQEQPQQKQQHRRQQQHQSLYREQQALLQQHYYSSLLPNVCDILLLPEIPAEIPQIVPTHTASNYEHDTYNHTSTSNNSFQDHEEEQFKPSSYSSALLLRNQKLNPCGLDNLLVLPASDVPRSLNNNFLLSLSSCRLDVGQYKQDQKYQHSAHHPLLRQLLLLTNTVKGEPESLLEIQPIPSTFSFSFEDSNNLIAELDVEFDAMVAYDHLLNALKNQIQKDKRQLNKQRYAFKRNSNATFFQRGHTHGDRYNKYQLLQNQLNHENQDQIQHEKEQQTMKLFQDIAEKEEENLLNVVYFLVVTGIILGLIFCYATFQLLLQKQKKKSEIVNDDSSSHRSKKKNEYCSRDNESKDDRKDANNDTDQLSPCSKLALHWEKNKEIRRHNRKLRACLQINTNGKRTTENQGSSRFALEEIMMMNSYCCPPNSNDPFPPAVTQEPICLAFDHNNDKNESSGVDKRLNNISEQHQTEERKEEGKTELTPNTPTPTFVSTLISPVLKATAFDAPLDLKHSNADESKTRPFPFEASLIQEDDTSYTNNTSFVEDYWNIQ